MAIKLSDLRRVTASEPPRLVIYGPPGMGKTTLASEFPDAVFLQCEDGTPSDVELLSFGKLNSFGEVMDALAQLYSEPHEYKTLVVDSITEFQRFVWAETCARGDEKGNPKDQIEHFGYGKGYVFALRVWQEFLDGVNALRRDRGMTIILIAHSKVDRFDDPESVSFDRYEIDLHDKAVGMIERDMDGIFLLKSPITIKTEEVGFNSKRNLALGSGTNIVINTVGKPAFVAKNRYKIPEKVPYILGHGYEALAPYFPKPAIETKE